MNLKSPCWRQVYSITFDYVDAYILFSGTITIIGAKKDEATKRLDEILHRQNKQYCNDNAKYVDVVMSIYNLIGCSDNFSKTSVYDNIIEIIQIII